MTELTGLLEQLLPLARSASERAYSPYSGVCVGAAVTGESGQIHVGCNMENASYGLTQCAECNALGSAIAAGEAPGKLDVMLVFASGFEILTPCGACRQVMSELLAPAALVICCAEGREPVSWRMNELLPDPFTLDRH